MKGDGNLKVLQILSALSAGGAEGFVTNLGVSLASCGVEVRFFFTGGRAAKAGAGTLAATQGCRNRSNRGGGT